MRMPLTTVALAFLALERADEEPADEEPPPF